MGRRFINFFIRLKKDIQLLTTSPILRAAVLIPIGAVLCMLALIVWQLQYLPPEIPLYYSRPWGQEQLAPVQYLFILPLGCFLWYVFSLLLIHFRMYKYRVFSQLLIISQSVLSLGCVFILIQILLLMR